MGSISDADNRAVGEVRRRGPKGPTGSQDGLGRWLLQEKAVPLAVRKADGSVSYSHASSKRLEQK